MLRAIRRGQGSDISVIPLMYPDAVCLSGLGRKQLAPHEIHVWSVNVGGTVEPRRSIVENTLTDSELRRADDFHFKADRHRWIRSRVALRETLGSYVGTLGRRIEFSVAENGKPFLESYPRLQFNLSYSKDVALVAVARNLAVGVDVEHKRPDVAYGSVVRDVFSHEEMTWLGELGGDAWLDGFYRCWVRKEAYVKATGAGLGADLQSISVTPETDGSDDRLARDQLVLDLASPSGYAAALAISDPAIIVTNESEE